MDPIRYDRYTRYRSIDEILLFEAEVLAPSKSWWFLEPDVWAIGVSSDAISSQLVRVRNPNL